MIKEEKTLLNIQGLYFFAGSIAGVFFNVFLFKLSNFRTVALYQFYFLTFLLIWYLTSGWVLKRFSSRTLIRFGLLCLTLGWGSLFLLKEKAINFLFPLGFIFGTGAGNFWSGFNLSQYILTYKKTREKFFAKANWLINLASAFGPIIGGSIIFFGQKLLFSEVTSYTFVFLTVTLINIVNFILTTKSLPRHSGVNFSLNHIISHKRSRNWLLVLFQQFLLGIWDVAFGVLSGVLLFIIFKKELILGAVSTIWAIIIAVSNLGAGNLLSKHKKMLFTGMIGVPLGILLFAFFQNWYGVFALIFIYGISIPFLNIPLSTAILNTIDENKESWQNKYHFLLERDFSLGLARILNYLFLFLSFSTSNQVLLAKQWTKFISIFPLTIGVLLLLMKKKINK